MKKIHLIAGTAIIAALLPHAAAAQGWSGECLDPKNTAPYSPDYGTIGLGNGVIFATQGISGTVTYGSSTGPCYAPAVTLSASGRMAFMAESGSMQTAFDDNLALTQGAPSDPVGSYCFSMITVNGDTPAAGTLYSGMYVAYVGASKKYFVTGSRATGYDAQCQMRIIGDATRIQWTIANTATVAETLGMFYALSPGMRAAASDSTGAQIANSPIEAPDLSGDVAKLDVTDRYCGFTVLPTGKPLRVEQRWFASKGNYPSNVRFLFGQTDNSGLNLANLPTSETPDASPTDFFIIGDCGGPGETGIMWDGGNQNKLRLTVFDHPLGDSDLSDVLLQDTAIVQQFYGQTVAAGSARTIVQYVRQAWSAGAYLDPYTVLLDLPKLIQLNSDLSTTQSTYLVHGLIDNQYADINKEIDLQNVQLTCKLGKGLKFAASEGTPTLDSNGLQNLTKTIPLISANALADIKWSIVSDGVTYGDIPVYLTTSPTPGPTKTIQSTIRVAAGGTTTMNQGANLVAFPYTFGDNSLDKILKKSDGTLMQTGTDYVAYQWDADLKGYVPVQSVQRGLGYWVVANANPGLVSFNGAAQTTDLATGGFLVSLKQGWNLISNPYNYPIPLNQIVGVAQDNPGSALTWDQMVSAQYIQPTLAYWIADPTQPNGGTYKYTQDSTALLEPQQGYWVFTTTFNPISLQFPPVYYESLLQSGRAAGATQFPQNSHAWRLQLSARSDKGFDSDNYVGVVSDSKKATQLQVVKPPMAPNSQLELSIQGTVAGNPTRMAQAVTANSGKQDFTVNVNAKAAGPVTVTWPNLASLPRNVRAKLTDAATGQKVDLRASTSYTFTAAQAGTRSFTLSIDPSGSAKAVIGNVVVGRSTRSTNSPVSISYSLSADSLTTIRILSSTGKEVYMVASGRADSAGDNSAVWALRDNANRAVAPGTYKVEILAETPSGDRVRRLVPVNVIR